MYINDQSISKKRFSVKKKTQQKKQNKEVHTKLFT